MNTASINNPPQINTCLYGQGIVCGLTVHVNEKCDVELGSGTAITASGTLIEIPNTKFDYYQKTPSPAVSKYFPHTYDAKNRTDRAVLELIATGPYNPKLMDSLKQQNPKDSPTRELLTDKIMVILFNESNPKEQYFLLVSPALLLEKGDPAILNQIKGLSKTNVPAGRSGIFARPKATTVTYSTEVMDAVFHPHLQLLEVHVPRFGYKTLGIADLSKPFGVKDNFVNPFTKISKFAHIFNEYKAILDDLIPEFDAALEKLHTLYGNQLTHKGKDYWAQYRKILREKWLVFLEQGDYLFYIQYYYDWLTDLVKAYEELCEQLSAFNAKCLCDNKSTTNTYGFLQLGPVLGGRTGYTPVLFRDYFQNPLIDGENAEKWNEIRFLHWRMMMMIWTFDLPQLKLNEKVLEAKGHVVPAKEFDDSTNYFENTDISNDKVVNLEDLPLKFTPSQTPDTPLGAQAIPYYYPLDADSPYSLHRYWNYRLTQTKRTQHIRSYNAIDDKDSYTHIKDGKYHVDSQFPLAFNLRNYPFLRAEGHIGKVFKTVANGHIDVLMSAWQALIVRYNLTLTVKAIAVSELAASMAIGRVAAPVNIVRNIGYEHIGGLEQGQTLVLVYADTDEQIELKECRKTLKLEIAQYTIVADFTVPDMI